MYRCFPPTAALYLLIATASTGTAAAQAPAETGEIRGRLVEQASGHAVSGGSVSVRRAADTVFAGGALPREDGSFRVDGLAPGRYVLRVRAIGYAPLVRSDITISAVAARLAPRAPPQALLAAP